MKQTLALLAAIGWCCLAMGQTAIGHWRDCIDLSVINHIEVSPTTVYGAARNGVVCLEQKDRTYSILSRSTGLSDAGIATIAYDTLTGTLVIAYGNSNIDLLQRGRIYNLSDIKRSELTTNKEIRSVRFGDSTAYVCTDFGVVVLDLLRREVKETWYLGPGGTMIPIYDLVAVGDSLYVASSNGLLRAAKEEPHLAIADRWTASAQPSGTTLTRLASFSGMLLAMGYTYDPEQLGLYSITDAGFALIDSGAIASVRAQSDRLTVCVNDTVRTYDSTLTLTSTHTTYTWGNLDANDAIYAPDGTLWVAHPWDGIVAIAPDGSDETYHPNSPAAGDNVYRLVPFADRMMLCPGGHTSIYTNTYLLANLFTYSDHQWKGLNTSNGMLKDKYDLVDAAVNPRDTSETIVAIWGTGLASIRNNQVEQIYNDTTTGGVLERFHVGNFGSLRTSAIGFDRRGNLWTTVSNSSRALAVRRTDGSWQSFSTTALESMLEVDKLVCDSVRGYLWMAGRYNSIYVHDGEGRMARVDPNRGSKLQTENVNALVQDQNGNIWIGTNKGIKVIYDGYNAFKNGGNGETAPVACNNITITNGAFAEYLMAYENITAIAVDGANRKWVGTAAGGLYLLSANGMEQLEHFTTVNSPLFSDKILALGIHSRSGEVYVGSDRGLQVYRSTATYADATPREDIHAFPNPVRPNYDGPIAIKGFTRNALVHITDAAGHTVFSTQAQGGQAVWDGRTTSGERVQSGVYYVFASDSEGGNRSVAKILIVR